MVNYPATSSVAVQSARPFLNRILRVFTAAGDAGKVAIAEQFAHFAYNDEHSKEESLYPTSADPSAHAVRKDIANLSRHMHRQGDEARTGIAQQCKAIVAHVGGELLPLVGATSTDNLPPALDADGKYTLDLKVPVPTLANVFFVNWAVDGVRQQGTSGDRLRIAPKATPTLVWAEVHAMDGSNIAISWNIPAVTVTTATTMAIAAPADKAAVKKLDKATLVAVVCGELSLEDALAKE